MYLRLNLWHVLCFDMCPPENLLHRQCHNLSKHLVSLVFPVIENRRSKHERSYGFENDRKGRKEGRKGKEESE